MLEARSSPVRAGYQRRISTSSACTVSLFLNSAIRIPSPTAASAAASVMILVVSGVGFLIHVYSIGYMAHDGGYYRFFGYLNLFLFFMLTLVLANNYVLLFVGWEGVGLCSYLLIGFYFHRKSASDAANKAFLVNRIGDAAFVLGMRWK